jgi:hypothetical protein
VYFKSRQAMKKNTTPSPRVFFICPAKRALPPPEKKNRGSKIYFPGLENSGQREETTMH